MREHLDFMDGSNFHSAVSTTSSHQTTTNTVSDCIVSVECGAVTWGVCEA